MALITIDAKDIVSIENDKHFNECRTLQMLTAGILRIANYLSAREGQWEKQTGGMKTFSAVHSYGLDIDGTKGELDFIACQFHWFGVSVCNYARLVGFLRGISVNDFTRADVGNPSRCEDIRKSVDSYVNGVSDLANVLLWRNKIGAHFAITAPHRSDNVSTLDMSVMFPVAFTNGRYSVGDLTLTRKNASGTFTSDVSRWSVTEVFEKLIPRYWPNVVKKEALDTAEGIEPSTES